MSTEPKSKCLCPKNLPDGVTYTLCNACQPTEPKSKCCNANTIICDCGHNGCLECVSCKKHRRATEPDSIEEEFRWLRSRYLESALKNDGCLNVIAQEMVAFIKRALQRERERWECKHECHFALPNCRECAKEGGYNLNQIKSL